MRYFGRLDTGWGMAILICLALVVALFIAAAPSFAQEEPEAAEETSDVAENGEPSDEPAEEREDFAERARLELSPYFPAWMQYEVIGISIWQFMLSFLFILLGLMLKKLTAFILEKRIVPVLKRSPLVFDHIFAEAVAKPLGYLLLLGGLSAALAILPLPTEDPNVSSFVFAVLKILLVVIIVWFLFRVVDGSIAHLERMTGREGEKSSHQLMQMVRKALKATIGAVCFVWGVQLLGYNVSSLIAGLGIGGLAVALALQDTLANFFGSIFILLDRPFKAGDWIKFSDTEGTVEEIGFRSTRIRTFPATLVSVPNKTMASATIDNWSRMPKRRVTQTVGVTYETTPDQMEQAVVGIQRILENDEGVHQELLAVRFTEFGDSSLNIFLLYFTKDLGFLDHAATRQRVNLAIMRLLEELGLSIAFPTRTVYMRGDDSANGRESQPG